MLVEMVNEQARGGATEPTRGARISVSVCGMAPARPEAPSPLLLIRATTSRKQAGDRRWCVHGIESATSRTSSGRRHPSRDLCS